MPLEGMVIYLKKILVATDMSEYSLAAVDYASTFGLFYSSKLYMLYVAERPPLIPTIDGGDLFVGVHHPKTEEAAWAELEDFVANRVHSNVKITPIVRVGSPAHEIVRFAEESTVDLIVMATHGRTGLSHIVMGSVAEKVVRLSSIPVLTVKPGPLRESILDGADVETELHLR